MPRPRKRNRASSKHSRQQSPYFNIPYQAETRNPWPPLEIASPQQIEPIHQASMHILENTGLRFLDKEAMDVWEAAGSEDIVQRANKLWKDIVRQYEQPPLDIAIEEELTDYIARRARESENVDLYD